MKANQYLKSVVKEYALQKEVMGVNRIVTNICSDDLTESRKFYTNLLGFEVLYQSDWYIHLVVPTNSHLEFGIIRRDHELVPTRYQSAPTGMYITFVVEDVGDIYANALKLGLEIVQPPNNQFYGQRRFLTLDPNGCLVDICSPWAEHELTAS